MGRQHRMDQTEQFLTMGGHLDEEGIALYVDALKLGRTSELPEKILRHVAECQRCRLEIMGPYDLVRGEDYSRVGEHPFFDRRTQGNAKKRIPIYRIAAGFAIVLALGAAICLLSYFRGGREEPVSLANQARAVPPDTTAGIAPERPASRRRPAIRKEDLATRFEEFPELESYVGSERRSEAVSIISPLIGQTVQGEVSFRWESDYKPPFTLTILSNRGAVRKVVTLTESHYVLDQQLMDGLYYWQLVAERELLCVGKFFVKSQLLKP